MLVQCGGELARPAAEVDDASTTSPPTRKAAPIAAMSIGRKKIPPAMRAPSGSSGS
jgi:hypothetical protein